MKLKGRTPGLPAPTPVVFERGDDQFVFMVQAVLDYTEFDKLCKEPKPKISMKTGKAVDTQDHKDALLKYAQHQTHWTILKALEATEGLEWETVDMDNPETWANYKDELIDAGLTNGEVAHLFEQVADANSVDEKKMQEARDRFFRSQEAEDTPLQSATDEA